MTSVENKVLLPYSDAYPKMYKDEAGIIQQIIGAHIIDIQHIGSTSIPNTLSKPIIDIAVLINSFQEADALITPLESLGYRYEPTMSSPERHFFKKSHPTQYHLSIAYKNRGGYWKRQILFRDYLRTHDDARKEYGQFKLNLLREDATIDKSYKSNKNEFVDRILNLARKEES